jgi:hypothetical protein
MRWVFLARGEGFSGRKLLGNYSGLLETCQSRRLHVE